LEAPSILSFNMSPDGSLLAYSTFDGGQSELWAMENVNGTP
jgi:hypothetical protein